MSHLYLVLLLLLNAACLTEVLRLKWTGCSDRTATATYRNRAVQNVQRWFLHDWSSWLCLNHSSFHPDRNLGSYVLAVDACGHVRQLLRDLSSNDKCIHEILRAQTLLPGLSLSRRRFFGLSFRISTCCCLSEFGELRIEERAEPPKKEIVDPPYHKSPVRRQTLRSDCLLEGEKNTPREHDPWTPPFCKDPFSVSIAYRRL